MLGFANGEPTEELHYVYGDGYGYNMRITSCSGEEASLFDCEFSEANYCGQRAGVICSHAGNLIHSKQYFLKIFAIVFVAVSGKLVQQGAKLGTDEYCLAENWETSSGKDRVPSADPKFYTFKPRTMTIEYSKN